jgi:hypothetical protein
MQLVMKLIKFRLFIGYKNQPCNSENILKVYSQVSVAAFTLDNAARCLPLQANLFVILSCFYMSITHPQQTVINDSFVASAFSSIIHLLIILPANLPTLSFNVCSR